MHSAKWDSSYDLKGKTVAVIGGGSSAVQIIPSIQPSKLSESIQRRPTHPLNSCRQARSVPSIARVDYNRLRREVCRPRGHKLYL
jgi:cation diffusion facilitator CzcD-associated flavoprotein CzcO